MAAIKNIPQLSAVDPRSALHTQRGVEDDSTALWIKSLGDFTTQAMKGHRIAKATDEAEALEAEYRFPEKLLGIYGEQAEVAEQEKEFFEAGISDPERAMEIMSLKRTLETQREAAEQGFMSNDEYRLRAHAAFKKHLAFAPGMREELTEAMSDVFPFNPAHQEMKLTMEARDASKTAQQKSQQANYQLMRNVAGFWDPNLTDAQNMLKYGSAFMNHQNQARRFQDLLDADNAKKAMQKATEKESRDLGFQMLSDMDTDMIYNIIAQYGNIPVEDMSDDKRKEVLERFDNDVVQGKSLYMQAGINQKLTAPEIEGLYKNISDTVDMVRDRLNGKTSADQMKNFQDANLILLQNNMKASFPQLQRLATLISLLGPNANIAEILAEKTVLITAILNNQPLPDIGATNHVLSQLSEVLGKDLTEDQVKVASGILSNQVKNSASSMPAPQVKAVTEVTADPTNWAKIKKNMTPSDVLRVQDVIGENLIRTAASMREFADQEDIDLSQFTIGTVMSELAIVPKNKDDENANEQASMLNRKYTNLVTVIPAVMNSVGLSKEQARDLVQTRLGLGGGKAQPKSEVGIIPSGKDMRNKVQANIPKLYESATRYLYSHAQELKEKISSGSSAEDFYNMWMKESKGELPFFKEMKKEGATDPYKNVRESVKKIFTDFADTLEKAGESYINPKRPESDEVSRYTPAVKELLDMGYDLPSIKEFVNNEIYA